MKILRKASLIALILLLSIINYTWAQTNTPKNDDALINAFEGTGGEFLQTNINFNSKISDEFLSLEELEKINEDILEKLQVMGDSNHKERNDLENYQNSTIDELCEVEKTESLDHNQIILWGKDSDGNIITSILLTERDPYKNTAQTSLYIDVIQNENLDSIKKTKEKINKIFDQYDSEAEITTCIIGTFEGELKSGESIAKVSQAINSIQGSKVEGLIEPSLISISVYTPNIENYIYTGNNKMNLNISMRYNEYEGKTYIWMGTPIITVGY